jgi:peptidoglycan hydrolase-like protein with peptidoglycan-binding domain
LASRPEQHAQIQERLIALGLLDEKANGEFGSNTRAAIRQFKVKSGASD